MFPWVQTHFCWIRLNTILKVFRISMSPALFPLKSVSLTPFHFTFIEIVIVCYFFQNLHAISFTLFSVQLYEFLQGNRCL